MDLAIRQALQNAVADAVAGKTYVKIHCKNGSRMNVRADLVCHETCVEATNEFGVTASLAYADIDDVSVARPIRNRQVVTKSRTAMGR